MPRRSRNPGPSPARRSGPDASGAMHRPQTPAFEFNEETTHGSTQQDRRGDRRGHRHRPRAGTGLCAGRRARRGRG
ncbi:hypothetical protein CBM2626_B140003 [Cupriavidus taiwanensis]|nr:hypothetical protein CBM2610_B100108 [Cupriavidus taiwanensis]SPA02105.1 hypothetical protein CBM2626_B140003 [Cupriavidus taiwanensis]